MGSTPLPDLTKMGLARRLEVEQGRNRLDVYNTMDKMAMIRNGLSRIRYKLLMYTCKGLGFQAYGLNFKE